MWRAPGFDRTARKVGPKAAEIAHKAEEKPAAEGAAAVAERERAIRFRRVVPWDRPRHRKGYSLTAPKGIARHDPLKASSHAKSGFSFTP